MGSTNIEELVQAAVNVAIESKLSEVDEKIQAAMNLGITIGAKAGAEIGAAAAIKAIELEQDKFRKRRIDKKLHNTKLLLKNYRTLHKHYEHAIFDVDSAVDNNMEYSEIIGRMNSGVYDDNMYIESIKQSCLRTKIIMAHVDSMLNIYKAACNESEKPENKRRWRILYQLYLSPKSATVEEIAIKESIVERTVYKDIDICVNDLSTLFFGIGGLENM